MVRYLAIFREMIRVEFQRQIPQCLRELTGCLEQVSQTMRIRMTQTVKRSFLHNQLDMRFLKRIPAFVMQKKTYSVKVIGMFMFW